mgnify:CR=1 FL=1
MTDTDDLDFDDEIGTATGSNYARQEDLDGCLLLIRPYEQGTRASKTNAGQEYTWVEGDVVVLATPADGWPTEHFDGEKAPLEIEAFQFTGQNVTGQLLQKMRRGKKVLGVLEQVLRQGLLKVRCHPGPGLGDQPAPGLAFLGHQLAEGLLAAAGQGFGALVSRKGVEAATAAGEAAHNAAFKRREADPDRTATRIKVDLRETVEKTGAIQIGRASCRERVSSPV